MEQQSLLHSPDTTYGVRTQARARQLSTRLQAYDVALPKSLIPDPVLHESSYHLPRMDSPAAQFDLSGQAEPVSTVEQLPMGDLSLVQYGEVSAMSHQLDVERSVGHLSSSVAPPGYHSPSECDSFSSGAASPIFQVDVRAQTTSPPVVRPKATAVSSVLLPHLGQSFQAQTAHIDISQQSVLWHVTQGTLPAAYGTTSTYRGAPPLSVPHVTPQQGVLFSTVDSTCQLTSSLPHTVTSVKLPLTTTAYRPLVPPVYQLQAHMPSQATRQSFAVSDPYRPPLQTAGYHPAQPPVHTPVQPGYPPSVVCQPPPPFPVYQPLPVTPQLQPVPIPALPKLVNDSEREFTDLKMALDNLLNPHTELTEHYKYRVLMEQLVLEEARLIAQACRHHPAPYMAAMIALQRQYGQPHQLAQSEIAALLNSPDIRVGDAKAFQSFALNVDLLVGMLMSLEGPQGRELSCTGHVDRLLSKLPKHYRDSFIEHLQLRGRLHTDSLNPYNLHDLADWLKVKAEAQRLSTKMVQRYQTERVQVSRKDRQSVPKPQTRSTAVYHGSEQPMEASTGQSVHTNAANSQSSARRLKRLCLFCKSQEHYLSQCSKITECSPDQILKWIKDGKRCWKCGRTSHKWEECTLKKPCRDCGNIHLGVLHSIAQDGPSSVLLTTSHERAYLTSPSFTGRVYLKVVPVLLWRGKRSISTYAILDDGAQRSIILPAAVQQLGIDGREEIMALRTIRHDITELKGQSIDLLLSPQSRPEEKHSLTGIFTAPLLTLTEQTYPIKRLQRCYHHLRGIPIPSFARVQPLILIGSDYPTLITPKEPIRLGPAGGPVAVRTQLGWVLQGPDGLLPHQIPSSQCLFTSLTPLRDPVYQHVERLWQLDVLPSRSEKVITRSKQDQMAAYMLETKTRRVEVDGVRRYATPLLRAPNAPPLKGTMESVLSSLRNTEKHLSRDPERAKVYEAEIQKLLDSGYVVRVPSEGQQVDEESWFIPHHLVQHNGKYRLVFNCSFAYQGMSLNQQLLPGPTLGASLLGVLLRFRQYAVAISGDIRGMFHQVRLLPEDRPLLRFIWRNMPRKDPPDIYEWQVLPFGTTCSPCCATFALQMHVRCQQFGNEEVLQSIERSFYVDNCLQSLPTAEEAKRLIDKMRPLLASGGFEIRQWATNIPSVVQHLPSKARSESIELWLRQNHSDPLEPALGLMWHCLEDSLGYRHRTLAEDHPTMRYIYKVLATQYDPLGFSIPFTTRAKVLVQRLWNKPRDWDDPNLPAYLLEKWTVWEKELPDLYKLTLPRCYLPADFDVEKSKLSLHVFGDASEVAYGSVAYLRAEQHSKIHTTFVMARSRVAPKRQLSMPRLELCAALTSAQLAQFLKQELTIAIETVTLWTDSTTVLTWIQSESCRYKVFVGTRVAEIQELTELHSWRYVDSSNNPADDITRGRTLKELANSDMWSRGPGFLREPPDHWPVKPLAEAREDTSETRKAVFCGLVTDDRNPDMPDASQYTSWSALVDATYRSLHGAAAQDTSKASLEYRRAEALILSQCQEESFPEEFKALKSGNQVPTASRLNTLAPEFDPEFCLIRVGGRLRRLDGFSKTEIHPVVLDPHHQVTKLIVKHFDERLLHPGPDRVFAELRRHFWILRGRQAIKRHQRECVECQKWRAKPTLPIMSDLPSARLRLYQPPFFSTGVDCFGPFMVKIGRRTEKRWGVIFKCLTTRCIHLDLLSSIDTDAFLLALRRFIARRGTPSEIISDQGTNFRGAETELREAFKEMEPRLQEQLASYQITFRMNPPAAPHFGGAWEREIRSVKSALRVVIGSQSVPEDVLQTVLIEVEGILNSKPLGYVSSDVADLDPITPNMLLMGRRDASLPQVVYTPEPLSKRRWRHSQTIIDHFWSYFTQHYLPGLQTRQKWQRVTQDLAENTVVMIIDPQLPRAQWPIGRVVKLIPSADGHVRSAQVQVNDRLYLRPVAKLVRLPALPDGGEADSND
ncbi:uncharacterized protein LOC113091129 [Carassius auratus]|uniref:ribonuclease H n=1 Tax=Carassius auratus TaxID=7957 RepID=A0A6P6NUS7_CARAU|nr:uncharacterized protein LOC113091129 [Carassius auratus]